MSTTFRQYMINENKSTCNIPEEIVAINEYEEPSFNIDDDLLKNVKINCYNIGQQQEDSHGRECPYNPKKFPTKAIQLKLNKDGKEIELYFDTNTKCWDSNVMFEDESSTKLSFDQFEQFFKSGFYKKLLARLYKTWPLTDNLYHDLYNGLVLKKIQFNTPTEQFNEDDEPKDDDVEYTRTGRKVVDFSDFGVKTSDAMFYCWPNPKRPFAWSQWKDWTKIKPLCKMIFKHGNYHYSVSVPVLATNFEHRGFRCANLDLEPKLQYLTVDEAEQVMKLSIVQKFIKKCIKNIEKYTSMSTEDIYAKMNNAEKITPEQIEKTKKYIKATTNEILKKFKADDYIWMESDDEFIDEQKLTEDAIVGAMSDAAIGGVGGGMLPPAEGVPATGDVVSTDAASKAKPMSDLDILFGGKPWDGKLNQNKNPKSFLIPKNILGNKKILKRYPQNVNMKKKKRKGVIVYEDDAEKRVNNN